MSSGLCLFLHICSPLALSQMSSPYMVSKRARSSFELTYCPHANSSEQYLVPDGTSVDLGFPLIGPHWVPVLSQLL